MNSKPKPRSGFNWKQKDRDQKPRDDDKRSRRRDDRRSMSPHRDDRQRDDRFNSYRRRSPEVPSSKSRRRHSPADDDTRDNEADSEPAAPSLKPRVELNEDKRPDAELTEEERADRRMREIFGAEEVAAYDKAQASKPASSTGAPVKEKKARKDPKPAAAPAGNEPTIIVHVNDRLGRKAAIPMLPSDKISHLKIFVTAMLGLQEGTFVIKRQGMAPFKDHISLADYEITHGVQLDLEPAK